MAKAKFRRRKVVVDRKFQFGVTLRIVGLAYVWLVFFAFLANLTALKVVVLGGTDEAYYAAVDRLTIFAEVFVAPLVLAFICICVHGFWLTHRLAGPVMRFRLVLAGIRERKLPARFQLRERDYFQDLSEEVNRLLAHLRDQVHSFHEISADLAREGEQLLALGDLCDEDRERLLAIANSSSRLRQMVDGYYLEDEAPRPQEPVPAGA